MSTLKTELKKQLISSLSEGYKDKSKLNGDPNLEDTARRMSKKKKPGTPHIEDGTNGVDEMGQTKGMKEEKHSDEKEDKELIKKMVKKPALKSTDDADKDDKDDKDDKEDKDDKDDTDKDDKDLAEDWQHNIPKLYKQAVLKFSNAKNPADKEKWRLAMQQHLTDMGESVQEAIHRGKSYGADYDPSGESAEPKKDKDDSAPKGRGRPAGSLGAAKKSSMATGDSGKKLQDLLIGKVHTKLPKNAIIRKIKMKESLDEMVMGATNSPSGKKVEWISHPGLGHSVTVNGEAAHHGFVPHQEAAKIYASHLNAV